MGDVLKKLLGVNWKTTLAGIATFLTSVPQFIAAITAWANHQPVDWRQVLVATALAAVGAGLLAAKDSTTHSTIEQIAQATINKPVESSTVTTQTAQPLPDGGVKLTTAAISTATPKETKP